MNLQPRRAKALDFVNGSRLVFSGKAGPPLRGIPDNVAFVDVLEPSIWRMELPNTSYTAPQSAFWWVSNDK